MMTEQLNGYSIERIMTMAKKGEMNCDCSCIHEDVLEQVRADVVAAENLERMAVLYKMFGDKTRLNILSALNCHEMCVCDLAVLMDMTKSAVSHQLRVLRENKLVTFEKIGKHSYYSLADDHVKDLLDIAFDHVTETGCDHTDKVHRHE